MESYVAPLILLCGIIMHVSKWGNPVMLAVGIRSPSYFNLT